MAKISIIIPCKTVDAYAKRCIAHCSKLKEDIELLVVTDVLCPGLPSEKRNWAMDRAKGDIYAFIDSDAYPSQSWLKNALHWLQCHPAVCGPGVLPPDAPYEEKVADQVHKWVFCPYRVTPQAPRMVPWHPTFNLIVRREAAGRFDDYLTGEDDKFGLNIKGGIFYHPDILVYHNRRGMFKPLWKQFGTYARHKGHFFRLKILDCVIAWISTIFVYGYNFVKGFLKKEM